MQKCDKTSLAVSKLCCPVCWELLQVLRAEPFEFKARGYHTSLYPVDLPSWLPESDIREMNNRFWKHLRREFDTLTQRPVTRKTPRYSGGHPSAIYTRIVNSVPCDDVGSLQLVYNCQP